MGDTGQVASKALPDPVRYSPPRLPNSNAASNGNHSHNDATANNTQTSNNRVSNPKANGHIGGPVPNGRISDAKPNGHTVDSKSNGHSDDHMGPFLPAPAKDARPSQPASHDTRAPPNHSDNHHKPSNNSNIPAPPPPPGRVEEKPGGRSQNLTNSKANQGKSSSLQQNDGHPRYYDDYELMKRRKQMESQGWPRDPKDYLIGGIYGPQPKSKPNESQQQQQSHHAAAPSHLDRRQGREPHRSKSFPRDARAPDDSLSRDRRPNNNRSNNNNSNLINNANKRAGGNPDRAFVLIDGHEGDAGRSRKSFGQGRGPNNRMDDFDDEGMATDYEHDVRRLYPKDGGSPTRNGPKQANRKPQDPLTKRRPTRPSIVEDAVVTSDIINNDGLNTYKARLVTFYKNGDLFFPGIKISLRPGRDFSSFEALCNYLTPRTDLPTGVRYIFTLGGRKVLSLDEFQDGGHYVCSSRKKFIPMNYTMGKRDEWKPHSKFATQQDMKLFRPPSQGTALGAKERRSPDAQPGSREGRVIRVINNEDHTIQVRLKVKNSFN